MMKEKIISIKISPGILLEKRVKDATYLIAETKNGKIDFKEKKINYQVLSEPFEKIIIKQTNYLERTKISYLQYKNNPRYSKYFEVFKKEPKDIFSKFKGSSLFPKP